MEGTLSRHTRRRMYQGEFTLLAFAFLVFFFLVFGFIPVFLFPPRFLLLRDDDIYKNGLLSPRAMLNVLFIHQKPLRSANSKRWNGTTNSNRRRMAGYCHMRSSSVLCALLPSIHIHRPFSFPSLQMCYAFCRSPIIIVLFAAPPKWPWSVWTPPEWTRVPLSC